MKKWTGKKIVLLLLSVSLVLCLSGAPLSVNGSAGLKAGALADAEPGSGVKVSGAEPGSGVGAEGIELKGDAGVDGIEPESSAGVNGIEPESGVYAADGRSVDTAAGTDYEAEVTVDNTIVKYKEFVDAWKDMQGKTGTIRLLKSVNMKEKETGGREPGDTDNLHVLFMRSGNITLEMNDNVELYTDEGAGSLIQVMGGTLTLSSGKISHSSASNGECTAVIAVEGYIFIKGDTIIESKSSTGLNVYPSAHVSISGGTFIGKYYGVKCETGITIGEILANGYALKKIDDSDPNKNEWENDTAAGQTATKVKAQQYPVSFPENPENQTMIYGGIPKLHAKAKIEDEGAVGGNKIQYQWYRYTKNSPESSAEEISEAKNEDYVPSHIAAGTYEYYCKATCGWFSLDSEHAVVKVEKRPLEAVFQGEIEKGYDGTKEVNADKVPPFQLNNVLSGDTVTASAVKAVFPSEKPGVYDNVEVELKLEGADAANYTFSGPVVVTGRILPLTVTDIKLNTDQVTLTVGGSTQLTVTIYPINGTEKDVLWTSSDPSVAIVDENGKVTVVGPGSAVITVTTKDGKFMDSCKVTCSGSSGSAGYPWYSGDPVIIPKKPFLIGSPSKQGWSVIREEAVKAAGSGFGTLAVDMNSTVEVPGSFFAAIRDSFVTAVLEMGKGITWNIYGKDISAETVLDMDFSVKKYAGAIPEELTEGLADGSDHLELRITNGGVFGFQATLTARIGNDGNGVTLGSGSAKNYAGMYANLFFYNHTLRRLEFVCADSIREDGTVRLPVTYGGDYTIILSPEQMDGKDTSKEPQKPEQKPQEPEKSYGKAGSVKLSKTVYTYNGKAKKPSVAVLDTDGKAIPRKYYTVSYKNNKNVGKATAVVSFKNGYTGTVKKTFTIRPGGTSIKKIKKTAAGFTVKWAKKAVQTSGYQIQYATNAGFKENSTRSIYVKNTAVTRKSVKKGKTGKKYYVRIRTYFKKEKAGGGGTKIYSAWSSVKPV